MTFTLCKIECFIRYYLRADAQKLVESWALLPQRFSSGLCPVYIVEFPVVRILALTLSLILISHRPFWITVLNTTSKSEMKLRVWIQPLSLNEAVISNTTSESLRSNYFEYQVSLHEAVILNSTIGCTEPVIRNIPSESAWSSHTEYHQEVYMKRPIQIPTVSLHKAVIWNIPSKASWSSHFEYHQGVYMKQWFVKYRVSMREADILNTTSLRLHRVWVYSMSLRLHTASITNSRSKSTWSSHFG